MRKNILSNYSLLMMTVLFFVSYVFLDNLNLYKLMDISINIEAPHREAEVEPEPEEENELIPAKVPENLDGLYYYKQLEPSLKENFRALYYGISRYEDYIVLPKKISVDDMEKLIYMLHFDCPDLFFLNNKSQYKQQNKEVTTYYPQYKYTKDQIQKMKAELEEVVSEYIDATATMTAYEKEKYIHDKLVLNTVYDLFSENNDNIYGCLIEGRAICKGYSSAATYLLRAVGIDTAQVVGTVVEDGYPIGHTWNMVKLDDFSYYYMDTCWDDINDENNILYAFFNIPYDKLSETHNDKETFEKLGNIPKNNDFTYYLYKNNGTYIETYEDALVMIQQRLKDLELDNNVKIVIQCNTEDLYNQLNNNLSAILSSQIETNHYKYQACNISNLDNVRILIINMIPQKKSL